MRALILALALAGCATARAEAQTASPPDWLSGYWLSCEDDLEVSETWIGAGQGMLSGVSMTRGARPQYEFLRIAGNEAGGYSYYAMPNGRTPATEFAMVAHEGQRVVFENVQHDFPQRIIYAREGDALIARIEDAGGRRGMQWTYRRAEADARCGS